MLVFGRCQAQITLSQYGKEIEKYTFLLHLLLDEMCVCWLLCPTKSGLKTLQPVFVAHATLVSQELMLTGDTGTLVRSRVTHAGIRPGLTSEH